jgi:hypothetical protein
MISFLICLCALLLPNNTPSGTITAALPPFLSIRKNSAKKSSSVFFVFVTLSKSAETAS